MVLIDAEPLHPAFWQRILQGDYWLFSRINQKWTSSFLDSVFPFMRQGECWVPFYLFLVVFVTLNFRRKGWLWCLYVPMTFIISELLSRYLVSDHLFRLRPCNNPLWADSMRLLAGSCPTNSGFASPHACHIFAMAVFFYRTLGHTSPWWKGLFIWAFLTSYAQVYVGIHYPMDILIGGTLGAVVGMLTSRLFRLQAGYLYLQPHNSSHA
ncbi:MAG TPA: phosphatase PAP2 family protein [Puia sp.]|nr:phosphatase PAP2 family protein [Puia sp.]